MTSEAQIPFLSSCQIIDHATRLLIAKRGVNGFALFLKKLSEMELFFAAHKKEDYEQKIHKYILSELVGLYDFKDSNDLLEGKTHNHTVARLIGIYFLRKKTNLSFASIGILYRKSKSRCSEMYKEMNSLKDAKGNIELITNFRTVESSLKVYENLLTNYERL